MTDLEVTQTIASDQVPVPQLHHSVGSRGLPVPEGLCLRMRYHLRSSSIAFSVVAVWEDRLVRIMFKAMVLARLTLYQGEEECSTADRNSSSTLGEVQAFEYINSAAVDLEEGRKKPMPAAMSLKVP